MFRSEFMKYRKLHLLEITMFGLFLFYLFICFVLHLENIKFYIVSRHLFYGLFVPAYIMILTRIIGEGEHDNNYWLNILISPKKKSTIFIEKFISIQGLVFWLYLLYGLFIIFFKNFYSIVELSTIEMILDICRSFFFTLPITLFFFIVTIENIPLLIYGSFATILLVANIMISQTDFWKYFPLTYPLLADFSRFYSSEAFSISVCIFIFLFLTGILRFYKKNW